MAKLPIDHGDERQRHMPEVVEDRARPGEIAPIVGGQAAQRKPLQIAAAGEEHDQQDGEQEGRDGAADDDGAEVQTSNRVPSRTALAMPSGIDIR